jgi:hypothetical protein
MIIILVSIKKNDYYLHLTQCFFVMIRNKEDRKEQEKEYPGTMAVPG